MNVYFKVEKTSLSLQECTGFLEEHVYMAGDHTTEGLLPVAPCQVLACVTMNNCCSFMPLSFTTLY